MFGIVNKSLIRLMLLYSKALLRLSKEDQFLTCHLFFTEINFKHEKLL